MLQTCSLMLPLGGCLLSGDMPEPNLVVPASYDGGPKNPAAAQAALPPLDWWTKFRSRELTALIEEARTNNLDIAAAIARIVQADAQARVTGAPLLPLITANGNAINEQATKTGSKAAVISLEQTGKASNSGPLVTNNLTATLSASYEIDFWGKNRAALRNAEELAVASRFDREVVGLTTMVAVANAYFQVLAAQDRLKAAREDIVSASRVLDLVKQRAEAGTASALEIAQQQSVVDTLRAAVPQLEQSLKQNRTALAVLMGRSPEQVQVRGGSLSSIAIPRVTPGLPSELLTQRPDIREAEANLAAANANVYNARAQFLPSITLTGDGGYESAVLRVLARPESAGVLGRGRPGAADLRGRTADRQSRSAEGQAGRTAAGLSQGGDLRICRRGERARRGSSDELTRDAANAGGEELAASLRYFGDAAARGHDRPRHGSADAADPVSGPGHTLPSAARTSAGDRQSLSSVGGRLATGTGGSFQCTVNCPSA